MMRKPSLVDYPGELALIMFTSGCNFRCGFCHNASLIERLDAPTFTYERLAQRLRKGQEEWVRAVTISGGEPTLQPQLPRTLRFIHDMGFLIKLDTNGSRPQVLQQCLPYIDYVAMDIKCGFSGYPEFVGFKRTEAIQESIKLIMESARNYEFRTTVVEGFHDDQQIREAAQSLAGAKRWVFQPFVPHEDLPDEALRTARRTPVPLLKRCVQVASEFVPGAVMR